MADDEDPMEYLAQKRQEMAAMAQMAEVAQLQATLAQNVQSRMQKIESLLVSDPSDGASTASDAKAGDGDEEVEFWKRKVAELSAPVAGGGGGGGGSGGVGGLEKGRVALSSAPSRGRAAPVAQAEEKLSWSGTESFAAEQSPGAKVSSRRRGEPSGGLVLVSPDAKATPRTTAAAAAAASSLAGGSSAAASSSLSAKAAPKRTGGRGGAAAKFLQPSAPSSYGDADSGGGRGGADDAEVEYWRRKIAELSAPVPGTASTSARSSLLSTPAAHARYASSAFSSGGAGAKATSLADEPLSWEGTSSYRDEQKSDVRESAEEILLDRRQESKGL